MTFYEAIAQLNVLSSCDTEKEKREKYKECIYAILEEHKILEILKKHLRVEPVDGMGTERFKDIRLSIYAEDEEDNETVLEWLKKED